MPVATAPHMEMAITSVGTIAEGAGKTDIIWIMPYPPSLRRIPARIIDPATGASTWAFGSHRWVVYIGIFTRNAATHASHQMEENLPVSGRVEGSRKEE